MKNTSHSSDTAVLSNRQSTEAPLKDRVGESSNHQRQDNDKKNHTTDSSSSVKETAAETAAAAQAKVREATERAKSHGTEYLRSQKQRAVDELGTCCDAVRRAATKLEQDSETGVSHYVHALAEQMDGLKSHLEQRDIRGLFSDVQGFAKKRPELFYGGLFVAGLLGVRFLKASRDNTDDDDSLQSRNVHPAYQTSATRRPAHD